MAIEVLGMMPAFAGCAAAAKSILPTPRNPIRKASFFCLMSSRSSAAVTVRRVRSAAVSKTDQQKPIIFSIIAHNRHLGLGGSMLGYGLVGTIVVIAVIIFVAI
jgi:hypothetical protein